MLLKDETHTGLDISASATVLTYTNNTGRDLAVLSKVGLGTVLSQIVGGGFYDLIVLIDDAIVLPNSRIDVTTDQDYVSLQSRQISLQVGQRIVVKAKGQAADTSVDVRSVLVDVTPALASELIGVGAIPVDHDYGGADTLRVVDADGAGITDVAILVYLATDYSAGNRSGNYVRGRSTTNANGEWRNPVSLDAGNYILVFSKPGSYQTKTQTLVVT